MFIQDTFSLKQTKKLDLISKIYVWSVVFETLLFFVLVSQDVSLVGGNLSRILQFVVIVSLILKTSFIPLSEIRIFNPLSYNFKWYFIYFFFILVSLIYGYFSGAYEGKTDNFSTNVLRPGFEYFISLYYFIYFAILPLFLLRSEEGINYFFKVFFFMFFLSLFLGAVDFLLVFFVGYEFIPRHLSDMRHVGIRFHGIAGEPRDAFVHLFLGLSLLFLREIWNRKKFSRLWIPTIFFAALLTQSTSGILGLGMAAALIVIFQIPRMRIGSIFLILVSFFLISSAVGYLVFNSPRIQLYLDAAPLAINALETGLELPPVIMTQINNIYPIWIRWVDLTNLNFLPILMGTGLGTTSILNGYISTEGGVLNPDANIIRVFFESGIIGTLLFIIAFINPVMKLEKLAQTRSLTILMLLMIGICFGHRSSALFTFLGFIILVLIFADTRKKDYRKGYLI